MLDEQVRALWLAEAKCGRPPPPRLVAELEHNLVINWHHDEAFLSLLGKINPNSPHKHKACREASRSSGKSTMVQLIRKYLAEWVLPFLHRDLLPIRPENKNYLVIGRDQNHLSSEVMSPLKASIVNDSPWLRTDDWKGIIEDIDDPSPEGLRELSEMKSKGGQQWQSMRIDLANGVSFRARTIRQSARSLHLFACDIDDLVTENNAHESAQIMALIDGAIMPAIEPGGLVLVDGSPQQLGDLYDLIANNPDWDYMRHPAYDVDGSLGYSEKNRKWLGDEAFAALKPEDRHCLWPARLSFATLEAARGTTRESEMKFQREFMLQRVQDSTSLVHPEDLLAARDISISYEHHATPGRRYYGGCDPSGRKRDDAGFCVGHVLPDQTRIISCLRKLLANPHLPDGEGEMSVVGELNDLSRQFNCLSWTVEKNGAQAIIMPLARQLNPSIRTTGFQLGSNKHTSTDGWLGLRTLFRSRLIKLPYKTAEDRAITDDLVHQLRGLQFINGKIVEDPRRSNDLVSALFLMVKGTEEVAAEYSFTALVAQSPSSPSIGIALPGTMRQSAIPQRGGELSGGAPIPRGSLQSIHDRLAKWQRRR